MLNSDFTSSNHSAPDGFVSVTDADKIRSGRIVADFKGRYEAKFARAVDAEIARVAAEREVELARADMISNCPQGSIGDLIRAVAVEANRVKNSAPRKPPVQTVSVGIESAHAPPPDFKVGETASFAGDIKLGGQKLNKK